MLPTPSVLLEQAGVPALLVSDLLNIRYLTGLSLSAGFVLVQPRSCTLFADDRYLEMALQRARDGVKVRPRADLEKVLRKVPICGFEEDTVTVQTLRSWKPRFPDTKFVRTSGAVEECRRDKENDELRLIRRAHRITQELLRRVPSALRAGVTERDLAWKIRSWAHELGADGMAFDTIVAFGSHTSRPHHAPTLRALQKGHVVQIDVGAVYKGYCADCSQVFFTADPTPAEAKAHAALEETLHAVMRAAKPGTSTHALDQMVRTMLAKHGYETSQIMPHALGHGVGLDVHEGVILSPRAADCTLLANEVIALEPGLYFPGKFGMRLEETIVVPQR